MFIDRPVGIDLGTTNSEIAILDPSERDLLVYADKFGRKTIPSAVAWDPKAEEFLVGRAARNRRGREPAPVESIKRKMGQTTTVALGEHELTPEAVSAKILADVAKRMHTHLAESAPEGVEVRVTRAVITVPAYFDAPQVEATRRAGELANLEVIGVLQEPTAAAVYHTFRSSLGDGNFLIYDLGGGTFDVSILRCLGGEYQVLAIDGDNFLGGDDLDRRFAEELRQRLVDQGYALDLDIRESAEDRLRFQRLVHLAQEIKESFSSTEVVHVNKHEFVIDQAGEPVSFDAEIGRAEYEGIVASLIETTITCCERALLQSHEVAGVGRADIDHVVLVGGSTRLPLVIREVTEKLCGPSKADAPLQEEVDTCVALGAAVHAAQLGGLRLGNEEAAILFTSPLLSRRAEMKLSLTVEQAPAGVDRIELADAGGLLGEADLDALPCSRRLELELGEEAEQPITLSLYGGEEVRAAVPLALYRGDLRPRASALSKASVVAKDIAVEVVRAGRRERKVLIPRGTGLPVEVQHRFYTADRSGAVVLRLLQNRLPVRTLVINVPSELDVGASVDLTLTCDEAMRLEARAVVADQELWAQIEPARLEPPPSADEVDKLLADAEEVSRKLWGREATRFTRDFAPIAASLREVVATDPDKAAALASKLRLLVDDFRGGSGDVLTPPMHRFKLTLDSLRRVVYRSAEDKMVGMTRAEWEERIATLDHRGQAAWDRGDANEWQRVYNETQALLETATEREFAGRSVNDPEQLKRRLSNIIYWYDRLAAALTDFEVSTNTEVGALQEAERARLLSILGERVGKPLDSLPADGSASDLRRVLDQARAELERTEIALERLPQIGVVSERGGG